MGIHCAVPREWCSLDPGIAPSPVRYVEMSHTKPVLSSRGVLKPFPIWCGADCPPTGRALAEMVPLQPGSALSPVPAPPAWLPVP